MDDRNKYQSCHSLLVVLSFSLLTVSPSIFSTTTEFTVLSERSIVNLNFAANKEFVFSPRTLQWKAINSNGKVVRTGRGSGGRGYCPDIKRSCRTPTGTYNVISKSGPSCRSSRYPVGKGGAPMPYCMFFSRYYAIHGSPDVPNRNASHGCIRVVPSDARWLNQNFMEIGTKVVVQPY